MHACVRAGFWCPHAWPTVATSETDSAGIAIPACMCVFIHAYVHALVRGVRVHAYIYMHMNTHLNMVLRKPRT